MRDLPLISRVAQRWVRASFEERYAWLLLSMSLEKAKEVLGFPPNATPSPEEINKAYRTKAFQNHPDRGGDPAKMVEVNVAKDVLTGRTSPTRDYEPPPRREPPPPPPRQEPPKSDYHVEKGRTFEQAWADNGPPSGVEWKFVSIPEFFWSSNDLPGHQVWTLYGQTDKKHIFLGVKRRAPSGGPVSTSRGLVDIEESWSVSWVDLSLGNNLAKIAAKYLKSVGTGWVDAQPKPPRKYVAWPGGKPTPTILRRIPSSGGAALKEVLVATGLLSDDDPAVAGRKSVVEIYTKYSIEKVGRRKQSNNFKDIADSYEFFVRVNGKDCQLSDATVDRLKRSFIPYVLKWEISEGRLKNLSRMRGGGPFGADANAAIILLSEALTSEPSWLHAAIAKALKEYPLKSKTAELLEVRSEMTLKQASVALGISMYDLFCELHA